MARVLGVSRRTVHDWFESGCPGKSDSGYDLDVIRAWREENKRPQPEQDGEEKENKRVYWATRKEAASARRVEVALAADERAVIEVEFVVRLLARHIAEHNTQLAQLKDRVLGLLPPKLKAADRRRILAGIDKAVDDLRSLMAQAAEQWADEIEPENE